MTMLHGSTFQHVIPTDQQKMNMDLVREAAADFYAVLEEHVPAGADKTYLLRKLREVVMWANVTITRNPDGSARGD